MHVGGWVCARVRVCVCVCVCVHACDCACKYVYSFVQMHVLMLRKCYTHSDNKTKILQICISFMN